MEDKFTMFFYFASFSWVRVKLGQLRKSASIWDEDNILFSNIGVIYVYKNDRKLEFSIDCITFKIFFISCTNRCSDVINSITAIFLGVKLTRFLNNSDLSCCSLFVLSWLMNSVLEFSSEYRKTRYF